MLCRRNDRPNTQHHRPCVCVCVSAVVLCPHLMKLDSPNCVAVCDNLETRMGQMRMLRERSEFHHRHTHTRKALFDGFDSADVRMLLVAAYGGISRVSVCV